MTTAYVLSLVRRMDAAYAACQRTGNPVLCGWYEDLRRRADAALEMDGVRRFPTERVMMDLRAQDEREAAS